MLLGKQADVYFTGEMSHVSASPHHQPDRPKAMLPKLKSPTARGLGSSRGGAERHPL